MSGPIEIVLQYTWVTVALWVANLVIKFGGNIHQPGGYDPFHRDAPAADDPFRSLAGGLRSARRDRHADRRARRDQRRW